MGETPYSLVYGTEAVIPVDVGEPSLRYSHESGTINDKSRKQELDEINERRDMAYIRMVAQMQQAERCYNKKSKVRLLKVGHYVLKAKIQASRDLREGKLGWPVQNYCQSKQGFVPTREMEGKQLPNN
nr:uncharacterized protein LOC117276943 [Nicotiana tomentosiformis]